VSEHAVNNFINNLCLTASKKGISLDRYPTKARDNANLDPSVIYNNLNDHLKKLQTKGPIDFLLVITPSKTSNLYGPVKCWCDRSGFVSQCVDGRKALGTAGGQMSYAMNVLMKINAKLGGVNVALHNVPNVLKTPTVFSLKDMSDTRCS
jgi:hypothetical protein